MNSKTKRVTTIGMLCAITYVTMVVGRIPIILFLKYDPSDVIVTLGGFIWGPMTSCIVSVIVATLEMITVSDTGILGCIMNIVQTLPLSLVRTHRPLPQYSLYCCAYKAGSNNLFCGA